MINGYKLNHKFQPHDHRDYKLNITPNVDLPPKCGITNSHMVVFDQGELGSCSANVICNQILSLGPLYIPSRIYQYFNSRVISNDVPFDSGCTYRDAYKALAKFGFCDDKLCPYIVSTFSEQPSIECYYSANKTLVKTYKALNQCLYDIKYAIYRGHPVAIGIQVYDNFEPDVDGVIPMPTSESQPRGGHATLLTAYNDETKHFKMLNSWGTKWAQGGYCYLHYDFVLNPQYCNDIWVIDTK